MLTHNRLLARFLHALQRRSQTHRLRYRDHADLVYSGAHRQTRHTTVDDPGPALGWIIGMILTAMPLIALLLYPRIR